MGQAWVPIELPDFQVAKPKSFTAWSITNGIFATFHVKYAASPYIFVCDDLYARIPTARAARRSLKKLRGLRLTMYGEQAD